MAVGMVSREAPAIGTMSAPGCGRNMSAGLIEHLELLASADRKLRG